MTDDACEKLIDTLRGDAAFALFSKAVTAALEEVLPRTTPAAAASDDTALAHLTRFAASGREEDLKAAVASASRD
jgi:hypothetical protein